MYSNELSESKTCKEIIAFQQKKEKGFKDLFHELNDEICKYTFELKDLNFASQYPEIAKFKKNLYPALDKLLKQCDLIKDDKLKLSKIKMVYYWFMKEKKSYNDLENINKHSIKEPHKSNESPLEKKSYVYEDGNYKVLTINENCSDLKELEPHTIKPNKNKVKKILPPIKIEEEVKNHKTINTNSNNIETASKSVLNLLLPKDSSTNASQYTTQYNSSSFKQGKKVRKVSVFKSSKSNNTKIGSTDINKDNAKEKIKLISEKRSLSEINAFRHDWATSKSKLKEEVEIKNETNYLLKNRDLNGVLIDRRNDSDRVNPSNRKTNENDEVNLNSNNKENSMKKVRKILNNKLKNKKLVVKKIIVNSKNNDKNTEIKDTIPINNTEKIEKTSSELASHVAANLKSLEIRMVNEMFPNDEILNFMKLNNEGFHPIYYHETPEITENHENPHKRSISVNLKEFSAEKNNMLLKRKALNTFTTFEMFKLKRDLSKEKISIPLATMKRAFISPETKLYPKHYLPKAGYGLMSNPLLL